MSFIKSHQQKQSQLVNRILTACIHHIEDQDKHSKNVAFVEKANAHNRWLLC